MGAKCIGSRGVRFCSAHDHSVVLALRRLRLADIVHRTANGTSTGMQSSLFETANEQMATEPHHSVTVSREVQDDRGQDNDGRLAGVSGADCRDGLAAASAKLRQRVAFLRTRRVGSFLTCGSVSSLTASCRDSSDGG